MPKIHFLGYPMDLYRYKTFLEVIIDNKREWGVSLDYNSQEYSQVKRNFIKRKFNSLVRILLNFYLIIVADYVYIPPMVMGLNFFNKLIIWFCTVTKKKVIFDFYISLYDTFVLDRQLLKPTDKESKMLSKLDKWGHTRYRSIYLNYCEAKRYRDLNNLQSDEKNVIIPLSISPRPFAKLNYFREKEKNTFNMVWWGTYIPLHGLDKIINTVQILISEEADVHLYILGNNPDLSKEYKNYITGISGLSEYITISDDMTFTNGKLLPFIIERCDLAFGAFGDSEKARSVILNKAIEAVAMKIPVITQYSEAFQEYFDPETTLFYCQNNPERMAEKIKEVMSLNLKKINERLENSYKIYIDNFSIEASKKMFNEMLKDLEKN